MARLPEDMRAVLVLRAFHDLDYPEIAMALDLEVGTVKSRLSRARSALREALHESQEESDDPSERQPEDRRARVTPDRGRQRRGWGTAGARADDQVEKEQTS
jgi:RNA polymerase sigma-70 factor (ECF subfamily)